MTVLFTHQCNEDIFGNVLLKTLSIFISERFRATINVTSIAYTASLNSPSSSEFIRLAELFKQAVELEYATLAGQQTVTVLQFRSVYVLRLDFCGSRWTAIVTKGVLRELAAMKWGP